MIAYKKALFQQSFFLKQSIYCILNRPYKIAGNFINPLANLERPSHQPKAFGYLYPG